MSCAAHRSDDVGQRAYRLRRKMYRAARLPVGDEVPAPDRRFELARQRLGPQHPAVIAAVAARNDLAATAEDVALAVAAGFARSLPVLQRAEAEQEARLGALRAAELWTPAGGASFPSYARRWARKFVSQLADRSRAVSIGERARLRGERVEMVDVDLADATDDELDVDAADVREHLDRVLAQLPAAEVESLRRAFSRRRLPNLDESVTRTLDQIRLELDERAARCGACGRAMPPGRRAYCGTSCAELGRRQKQRASNERYQRSAKGRRAHARRQAKYRERQKVTEQTSLGPGLRDVRTVATATKATDTPASAGCQNRSGRDGLRFGMKT